MKGDTQYGIKSNPFRKDSLAFSANENIRGYDKDSQVNQFGSAAEQSNASHLLSNEKASRVGIQQSTVPVTAVATAQEQRDEAGREEGQEAGERAAEATEQQVDTGVRVNPNNPPAGDGNA